MEREVTHSLSPGTWLIIFFFFVWAFCALSYNINKIAECVPDSIHVDVEHHVNPLGSR